MRSPDWWQHVIDEVRAYHQANPSNLPGAVFAAETLQDGPLVSSVGQGWSDRTICQLGSMTKPFTATGVLMALEEHGRLDVEQLVCELPGMELYKEDEMKRQIKVRHLLQHTSGLPSYQEYFKSPNTRCNDAEGGPPSCPEPELDLGPTIPWVGAPGLTNECIYADGRCRPARTLSLDKVSSYVMQTYSPSFQPGSKFSLSEMAFTVAARIVEHLTGKSVNIYLKEKLFKPLGMKDTFFIAGKTGDKSVDDWMDEGVTEEQRGRIPDLAIITRDGKFPSYLAPGPDNKWDKFKKGWRYLEVSGGMYSTAEDLLAYLRVLRDGGVAKSGRVLSTEIADLLVKDQGFGHTMGFGYTDESKRHGPGAQTLMHLGGFITFFWYNKRPEASLLGVFLSQRIIDISTLTDGTNIIFKVFTPQVEAGVFGPKLSEPTR
jgi:CubicO group peptidase (beta-lactamase class C family)